MQKYRITFRRILFVLLLVFMVVFFLLIISYSPKEMIMQLGVRNSFVIAFFVSLVGAFTSLTKFSAYPMIIALVVGQMNPFLVGFVAGLGLASGDILFFLFGYSARDLAGDRWKNTLNKILERLQRLRGILVQCLIFFYVACTPFPNNLLSGSLAFTGYPFKKVVLPLVMGDVAFCILVAWLAFRGIALI